MTLSVRNLSHFYLQHTFSAKHKKQALENVSFEIRQGEIIGLVGKSGCGKSTLARLIAGLERVQKSCIFIDDKPLVLHSLQERRAFYKKVQITFQDSLSSLNPRLNIFQSLQEPLENLLGIRKKQKMLELIAPLFEKLHLNLQILYKYPAMLSGGEAQRVCLVKILLIKPKLLILDEVTSALSYELKEVVVDLLKDLHNELGCSFLFITHDFMLAHALCSRIMLMNKGKIIKSIDTCTSKNNAQKEFFKLLETLE